MYFSFFGNLQYHLIYSEKKIGSSVFVPCMLTSVMRSTSIVLLIMVKFPLISLCISCSKLLLNKTATPLGFPK